LRVLRERTNVHHARLQVEGDSTQFDVHAVHQRCDENFTHHHSAVIENLDAHVVGLSGLSIIAKSYFWEPHFGLEHYQVGSVVVPEHLGAQFGVKCESAVAPDLVHVAAHVLLVVV